MTSFDMQTPFNTNSYEKIEKKQDILENYLAVAIA
jgi:hypothetical protein